MAIYEKFMEEIVKEYVWFHPKSPIIRSNIAAVMQKHHEGLKPFGFKNILPCQLINIWPGKLPRDILKLHAESQKAPLRMLMENVLGVVREVAINASRLIELDNAVREVGAKVRSLSRKAAIEVAGLTAKATIPIPMVPLSPDGKRQLEDYGSDLDVVEKAIEDAAQIASWYISWIVVADLLTQKNYQNPFAPLVELFKLGLWPIGVVQKEYLVFVPGRRIEIL
jgi:hypothetical protein